jgi:hypothetical protein
MHYALLQHALTFACDSLLVGSSAYFGVGLAIHLKEKWDTYEVKKPAQLPAAVTQPLLESTAISVEAIAVAEKEAILIDPLEEYSE